jgi:hypothetical protein
MRMLVLLVDQLIKYVTLSFLPGKKPSSTRSITPRVFLPFKKHRIITHLFYLSQFSPHNRLTPTHQQVTTAEDCCLYFLGTWYQFYPVQAICVLPGASTYYNDCLHKYIPADVWELDTTCITGDGVGLTSATTTISTLTERITLTARAY